MSHRINPEYNGPFLGEAHEQRQRERVAAARERAKLIKAARASGQRLTDLDVAAKIPPGIVMDQCDMHRLVWKPRDDRQLACYFQRIPCNGVRGRAFECCYLCSEWLVANRQRLIDWFGLAGSMKTAVFLRDPEAFRVFWPVPFE